VGWPHPIGRIPMSRMARTAGIAVALLAGTAVPLLTAAPAQAAAQDCLQYLQAHDSDHMNQQVVVGCAFGAMLAKATCASDMTSNGVPAADAKEACRLAGEH
ncbi:hypothetical protein, partial [Kutzneria sp. 744]|uniref:hypothetical protein n=2 Tax=unclassified Kutzneria TaxID=2621979 RepID=UPI0035101A4D